jgi:L,D-transpeptidase catalytic domain
MDGWLRIVAVFIGGLIVLASGMLLGRTQEQAVATKSVAQQANMVLPANKDRLFLSPKDRRAVTLSDGERRVVSSLLNVTSPLRYGGFVWNEAGVPAGEVWVRVDLKGQTMSVFRGEHEIGTGVILFGADSHPTPIGRFPVMAKYKDHQSSIYDAVMPYTLRLTGDGVAIHGSNVRRGAATHGCIGIPTAFAAKVFGVLKIADPVYILPVNQ